MSDKDKMAKYRTEIQQVSASRFIVMPSVYFTVFVQWRVMKEEKELYIRGHGMVIYSVYVFHDFPC